MGVFQVRNCVSGKLLIDSSINVPGKINRHRLQLDMGSHPNKELQADWNAIGKAAFEFETLESVEPRTEPNYDYAADLGVLEDLWIEKAGHSGDRVYNLRKLTREERLRMIAANRKL